MTRKHLIDQIGKKQSFLCVGLDPDINLIPAFFRDFKDPILEFNRRIIELTKDYCVAYKPNMAFFESLGPSGWVTLQDTLAFIPDGHFTIADAKRGDIGNTARLYAKTFFDTYNFDAVTISPYMGKDSVESFLDFPDKWVILLGLTSNSGSADFQMLALKNGRLLYQQVMESCSKWGSPNNIMFVAGATKSEYFINIREIVPDHFLLVPGVGTQGGSLNEVYRYLHNKDIGILVNVSRAILFATDQERNFDEVVLEICHKYQREMQALLALG